jgi:AraC-type DNA-binding domain-containing proteins
MHAWEAIQTTLDYLETNLGENTPVEQLAERAALSPFYYQRLFSRLVKKPVREYVRLRRLDHASKALKMRDDRILDIALDCGFGSHESLTKAFKEAYGMTPEAYRKNPVMLNHFEKPDLSLLYTMIDEGVPLISEGMVLEYNRRTIDQPISFLGLTGIIPIDGQLTMGEDTGVDMLGEVWEQFHKIKHLIPRIPDGREIGVSYYGDAPEGCFTYLAGSEVAEGAQADGFTTWQLPAREYIICSFEAENFEQLVTVAINKAAKYNGLWLEKHNMTMKYYSPEIYYGSTPEVTCMEMWLPFEMK